MSNDPKETKEDQVQGEGNYEAAREYNESAREFVESGQAQQAQEKLKNIDASEQEKLEKAEQERDKRIHERDPAVKRDYSKAE